MTGAHQPPATRTPHSRGSGFDSHPDDTRACDVSRDRVRTGCCGAPKATSQLLAAAKTKSGCDTESSASPTSAYRPTNDPAVSERYSDAAQNSRRNRTTLKIRTFYNDFPDKDNLFFRDFQQPGGCDSQCTALVMSGGGRQATVRCIRLHDPYPQYAASKGRNKSAVLRPGWLRTAGNDSSQCIIHDAQLFCVCHVERRAAGPKSKHLDGAAHPISQSTIVQYVITRTVHRTISEA